MNSNKQFVARTEQDCAHDFKNLVQLVPAKEGACKRGENEFELGDLN